MSQLPEDLALLFINERRWIIPQTLIARPAFRAASYLAAWADGGPPPQEPEFASFIRQGSSLKTSLLLTFAPASMTGDRDPYNQTFEPLVAAGRVQRQKRRYLEYRLADVTAGQAVRARVTSSLMAAAPVPLRDGLLAVLMYAGGLWKWCELAEPPAEGRPVALAPDAASPYASAPLVMDLSGGRNLPPRPGPLQGRAHLLWRQYSKEVAEHRPGG